MKLIQFEFNIINFATLINFIMVTNVLYEILFNALYMYMPRNILRLYDAKVHDSFCCFLLPRKD